MSPYFLVALVALMALAGAMLAALNLAGVCAVSWWWVALCFLPLALVILAFVAAVAGMMDNWH